MKLTLNRPSFDRALRRVLPAAASNPGAHAALGCCRLHLDSSGTFSVSCTNLETQVTAQAEVVDTDLDGLTVLVPAARLAKVVGSMAGDTIDLDLPADSIGDVVLKAGRTKATLATVSPEGWPTHQDANDGTLVTFDAGHLQALKAVLHAVAADPAKPVLAGVHFAGAYAEATDGYRAVRATLDGIDAPDVIVPADAIRYVVGQDGVVAMRATSHNALLCGEGGPDWFELRTQLVQGNYLKVDNVLRDPEASPHHLTVDGSHLMHALARVSTVADEARRIRLDFEDGYLTLTSIQGGVGEVVDQVPADGELAEGLQVHASRFTELVANCQADNVTLETIDAMHYVVVHDGPVALVLVPLKPQ